MGLKVKHQTAAGRPCSVCQSPLSSSSFPLRCAAACTSCTPSLSSAEQHSGAEAGGLQNVDATRRRVMRLLNLMPMVRLMHALSQTQPVFGSALILSPGCGLTFFYLCILLDAPCDLLTRCWSFSQLLGFNGMHSLFFSPFFYFTIVVYQQCVSSTSTVSKLRYEAFPSS